MAKDRREGREKKERKSSIGEVGMKWGRRKGRRNNKKNRGKNGMLKKLEVKEEK